MKPFLERQGLQVPQILTCHVKIMSSSSLSHCLSQCLCHLQLLYQLQRHFRPCVKGKRRQAANALNLDGLQRNVVHWDSSVFLGKTLAMLVAAAQLYRLQPLSQLLPPLRVVRVQVKLKRAVSVLIPTGHQQNAALWVSSASFGKILVMHVALSLAPRLYHAQGRLEPVRNVLGQNGTQ